MLENRDYMRSPDYRASRWHTATATLLIINVAVFVLESIAPRLIPSDYLGLSWAGLRHGYLWQLLSFQFLHASLMHLLLNSIGLFAFGFAVEQFMGARRFVWLYLISGVIGGLVHVLGSMVWPSHFGVFRDLVGNYYYNPMVGASAGLFGLIAAFATMFPERNLTVFLFFILPVTVSARVLLLVSAGISVLGVIVDRSNVAHGAHAGGMLGGWLMLHYFSCRPQYPEVEDRESSSHTRAKQESKALNEEVDAILDKISRHGIQSLTARERQTLEKARQQK